MHYLILDTVDLNGSATVILLRGSNDTEKRSKDDATMIKIAEIVVVDENEKSLSKTVIVNLYYKT